MMFGTRQPFLYVQCATCDGLQLTDIPSDMSSYYPSDYYSFSNVTESNAPPKYVRVFVRRLQRALADGGMDAAASAMASVLGAPATPPEMEHIQLSAGARILDVGCGSGHLLRTLRDVGYRNLNGVDPFLPKSLTFRGGVTVRRAQLAEMHGKYDLVMMHHVFEHLENPLEMLRDAAKLLAPGGRILLRFPSVPCEVFDVFGADWVQLDAPRHLQIVSRVGMDSLAVRAGLRVSSWTQDSTPMQFWGSEQYQRDIPLRDSRSFASDSSVIGTAQMKEYQARSAELNRTGRGDQSVVVLEVA